MGRALALAVILSACAPAAAPSPAPAEPSITRTVPPSETAPPTTSAATQAPQATRAAGQVTMKEFPVPAGSAPHDVAPAADGGVWYTAQGSGELGWLDPRTGQTKHVKLGQGSSPHGVIVGPDGAPWITDSGLNAIVRVDPRTSEVKRYALPGAAANLNTAVFDRDGVLWWTGQSGFFGRVDPSGQVHQFAAPRGRGPYGITATPNGDVYYASLAGDHIAKVAKMTGGSEVIEPPTKDNGSRRVWTDSKGNVWASQWDAGQVARYDPASRQWKEWKLPGSRPQAYAVFVDDRDIVWLSDFGASAIVRFDPATERFDVYPHAPGGNVRQIHGRPGEVWGALSAHNKLLLVTTR
jgi:virginiamycin B lyase